MRKTNRRRPELEPLESLMLLSTVMAEASHARPVVQVAPVQVALVGAIHATGQQSGSKITIAGNGNLGAVGNASFTITANLNNPPSSVTLSTRRGKLFLASDSPLLVHGNSGSVHYHIAGGTGSYLRASGAGDILATVTQLRGHKLSATLRFT